MRIVVSALLFAALAVGQQFEVAAIKASDPASPVVGGTQFSPNRFSASGSLQFLLRLAYGVQDFQITGGPKWLSSDRFDIDAKPENPANPDQLKLMLRALLADRFKLVLHAETRELPVYALVVAKNGPRLQEVKDVIAWSTGRGRLSGRMPISAVAENLSQTLGRKVLDRTGLAGTFEIKLAWTPDESVKTADDSSGSSIFTAVQEQLGLKLESTKGPVEVLVIDRAEKPSEN